MMTASTNEQALRAYRITLRGRVDEEFVAAYCPAGTLLTCDGEATRMGSWLPEAVDFVKANQTALAARPVSFFTVHMLNTGADDASRAARQAYLKAVRPLLRNAEEIYFEGLMDFGRLSLLDRIIAKMVKSIEADHRDWAAIRSWTPVALASGRTS